MARRRWPERLSRRRLRWRQRRWRTPLVGDVREEGGRIAELVVGRGRVRATRKELKQQEVHCSCSGYQVIRSVLCSPLLCRAARSAFSIYRLISHQWRRRSGAAPGLGAQGSGLTQDRPMQDYRDAVDSHGSAHVLINHSDHNAAGACVTHYFHVLFVHIIYMYNPCTPSEALQQLHEIEKNNNQQSHFS